MVVVANASATPSVARGPVTQRMLAEVHTSPAARSAPARSVTSRPAT